MKIEGSTFLVTGGSSGLGRATVERLMSLGGNVVIADLSKPEGLTQISYDFLKTSVTNPDEVQAAVDLAFSRFGGLQGVINCAGVGNVVKTVSKKKFGALEAARQIIEINLMGTYNVISIASTPMSKQEPNAEGERGVFINTASVAAYDGKVGQAPYSASKGGVASMTLPLAREMAQYGFRVMAIAPGAFETPMVARLPGKASEELVETIPFPNRMGRPPEFAHLVQHIIENTYLNGEVIRLDGAIRMT
ncbi:SDR family NAD(P)-dependent oxidoreductase [Turneriella parva]|uniref:Short-chain dehydrogenase/reductase SDR n=1 Tax=Turneriella parva (strain ATCC BAA-1111 / DSM 21527 / NCTC 11395 / H) TaxID=869212 RepID=I4B4U3_TURPD|nr:SDR family NAD(P)-dependent oxidoreductase [Turneriella parva]AFM12300.1 short-chain dehydrogenase/reductase SDR [Turneriella parva DSM 21527]